jgi:putative ABC transport system permease protein
MTVSTCLIIGVIAALVFTRFMQGLLFRVRATDPLTLLVIALLLGLIILMATYIPARRTARIDPMVSLRWE